MRLGVDVRHTNFSLEAGESLSRTIDKGLGSCRLGILVISKVWWYQRPRQFVGKNKIKPTTRDGLPTISGTPALALDNRALVADTHDCKIRNSCINYLLPLKPFGNPYEGM